MDDDRTHWSWVAHLEPLVREVTALVARRAGRLVALSVTAPPGVADRHVVQALGARLAASGCGEQVELSVVHVPGPMRVLSVELEG